MEEAYNDTISQEPMLELRKGLAVGGCMSQEVAHDATSWKRQQFLKVPPLTSEEPRNIVSPL